MTLDYFNNLYDDLKNNVFNNSECSDVEKKRTLALLLDFYSDSLNFFHWDYKELLSHLGPTNESPLTENRIGDFCFCFGEKFGDTHSCELMYCSHGLWEFFSSIIELNSENRNIISPENDIFISKGRFNLSDVQKVYNLRKVTNFHYLILSKKDRV